VVIFEGRDAAGKGGVIKRITESLNRASAAWSRSARRPRGKRRSGTFSATSQQLPAAGEMVLFDRSWYNRAGVERVMGFCTEEEYQEFMRSCPNSSGCCSFGVILIKYCSRSAPRAGAPLSEPPRGPYKALEALAHGRRVAGQVGGVLKGQRRDVLVHGHKQAPGL
jgi:hypothetical protein